MHLDTVERLGVEVVPLLRRLSPGQERSSSSCCGRAEMAIGGKGNRPSAQAPSSACKRFTVAARKVMTRCPV